MSPLIAQALLEAAEGGSEASVKERRNYAPIFSENLAQRSKNWATCGGIWAKFETLGHKF